MIDDFFSHGLLVFIRDETYTESILEKQADLIRYLRERNDHLSRLVHQQSRHV